MVHNRIFDTLSFPNKIKEILHSHANYILGNKDGIKGLDTIQAVDRILEVIEHDIIGLDEPIDTEENILRKEQRKILKQSKGEFAPNLFSK